MKKPSFVIRNDGGFGPWYDFDLPPWADIIVVCVNKGSGFIPVRTLLPHQLHPEYVKRLMDDDRDIRWVTVLPAASSGHAITVAEKK